MKNMAIYTYVCPECRICGLEVGNFLCVSRFNAAVDQINSYWGDESTEYNGNLEFEKW